MTTRLAVLGSPIAHSKSPAIHAAAYAALGLDWTYDRVEVGEGGLADFVAGLDDDWRGLSLTMPLKREAIAVAQRVDPLVSELGQANTLLRETDEHGLATLTAFTTDAIGILGALHSAGAEGSRTGTVLGGGATAESAAYALGMLTDDAADGGDVVLAARRPERAPDGPFRVVELDAAPLDADVVVSTIPGGVELSLEVPARPGVLLDVVYDPWPTPLAAAWIAAGGIVVDGLEMLLHQALAQVRVFVTGDPHEPVRDEAAVWAAMRAAVGRGAGA